MQFVGGHHELFRHLDTRLVSWLARRIHHLDTGILSDVDLFLWGHLVVAPHRLHRYVLPAPAVLEQLGHALALPDTVQQQQISEMEQK